jgi:hypothetical protein
MGLGTTVGGDGSPVLEDSTGRRARWFRRAGRAVSLLFLSWLLAIVLGGLGLIPVEGIPLAHALQPSQGPPALTKPLQPRQPTASDLRPAVSARAFAATVANGGQQTPRSSTGSHGKSSTAPGQTKTSTSSTVTHGKSGTAPGQTKTSTSATVTHGKSATAPGKTKTSTSTTVTHGKSSTAPGQTKTTAKKP